MDTSLPPIRVSGSNDRNDLLDDFWVKRVAACGVPVEYLNTKTVEYLANVIAASSVEVALKVRDVDSDNSFTIETMLHE